MLGSGLEIAEHFPAETFSTSAGTMQLGSGSARLRRAVSGVPAETLSLHLHALKRCGNRWWNEVVSGTDTTARGTRALPVQLNRSGLGPACSHRVGFPPREGSKLIPT